MNKFVLICHARSGSNLLALSLLENSNIRMFLEIFNDEEESRKTDYRVDKLIAYDDWADLKLIRNGEYYRKGQDAYDFLDNCVYHNHHFEEIKAVGFKLFYSQARENDAMKRAWDYILENNDIKVIHLVRINLFKAYVSLEKALKTNNWIEVENCTQAKSKEFNLTVNPEACKQYFITTLERRQWVRKMLSRRNYLEITYENELCKCFETTVIKIFDFLNVPKTQIVVKTRKQGTDIIENEVQNYSSVLNFFKDTNYYQYFI